MWKYVIFQILFPKDDLRLYPQVSLCSTGEFGIVADINGWRTMWNQWGVYDIWVEDIKFKHSGKSIKGEKIRERGRKKENQRKERKDKERGGGKNYMRKCTVFIYVDQSWFI